MSHHAMQLARREASLAEQEARVAQEQARRDAELQVSVWVSPWCSSVAGVQTLGG